MLSGGKSDGFFFFFGGRLGTFGVYLKGRNHQPFESTKNMLNSEPLHLGYLLFF